MNRRFFASCLAAALVLLIAPALLAAARVPSRVESGVNSGLIESGAHIWRNYNCQGCHTLYGQGGDYAPDLTHSYAERGEAYLRAFLLHPSAVYSPGEGSSGDAMRQMPRFGLTRAETDGLIAFLRAVSQSERAAHWPPPPLLVNALAALPPLAEPERAAAVPTDPVAIGRALFSRAPANCATCHSLQPGVVVVGPSLAGVAVWAGARVPGVSAAEYLRTSILHPGDYIVAGFSNVMAQNLGDVLSGEQVDALVAFLLTLREPPAQDEPLTLETETP